MNTLKKQYWIICLILFSSSLWAENNSKRTTVGILIYDGVQIIDFTGPWEIFGQAGYDVITISKNGNKVTTAMNMVVGADYSFANTPKFDLLLVPGGHHHNAMDDETVSFVKQKSVESKTTLSVCTGSYILAETGLLSNQTATTFFKAINHFDNQYKDIKVVSDQRYVDNGAIITSAGLSSGIDAALHIVAKLEGIETARTIAMHVEYDWQPDNGFIRGKMADQHMPRFKKKIPDNIKLKRTAAFGGEDRWYETYEIQISDGSAPISTVEALLKDQLGALDNWKTVTSITGDNSNLQWKAESSNDVWLLSVKNQQLGLSRVKMTVELAKEHR